MRLAMQHFMRLAWIELIIAAGVLAPVSSECAVQDLASQFHAEAPVKWKAYRAFGNRLQGRRSQQSILDGTVVKQWQQEVKHNNGLCVLDVSETWLSARNQRYTGEVNVHNETYSFVLRRDSANAPWALVEFRWREQGTAPANAAEAGMGSNERVPLLLSVAGLDVASLVKEPACSLKRFEYVDRDGEKLARVSFARVPPTEETFPIQAGTLILDPNRSWVLRGYEIEGRSRNVHYSRKVELEVFDSSSGFPIPRRMVTVTEYLLPDGTRDQGKLIDEFVWKNPDPLPDRQNFTLTAFGFPEPPGVEWKQPIPLWLWVAGAAFACLILGGVFSWLRSRAAARRAAT